MARSSVSGISAVVLGVSLVSGQTSWVWAQDSEPPTTAPLDASPTMETSPLEGSAAPSAESLPSENLPEGGAEEDISVFPAPSPQASPTSEPQASPSPDPSPSPEPVISASPEPEPSPPVIVSDPEIGETQEIASEPAPAPSPAEKARTRRNSRIPPYQRALPRWGFQLSYSPNALGSSGSVLPSPANSPVGSKDAKLKGVSLIGDYQPRWIQESGWGVLGLGLQLNFYPQIPRSGLTQTVASIYGVGAEARYQLRFVREQWVVPVAGYGVESVSYRFASGTSARTLSQGPFVGAMLLLNFLDPDAAAEAFVNTGMARTYLFADYRIRGGGDTNLKFSGGSLFFGLRFEF